jgi:putative ABC transport system permease protein
MTRITVKGLLAHKLRLALTAIAIILGVTFISGTYVLTDTLHNTFDHLIGTVYKQIDFQVRGVAQFPTSNAASAVRTPLPDSLLQPIVHLPGVEAAAGGVSGYAQFVAPDGKPISNNGEGNLGISFDSNPKISELRIVEGGPPTSPNDVVMDAATAEKYHFRPGQQVRVLTDGPERGFTISGIAQYGTANSLAGITLAAFDLPTAQQISDEVGQFDTINVITNPRADKATVERAIAHVLPPGAEVVTGQTVQNEQTNSVDKALSFFSTALLVFAFIALFVGAFTIFNTFSIIVGQRTRELALLRIVGASRRQIFRSVLAEAAIVGAASSLIGVGLGVLAAIGIEALLRGFGTTLPSGTLVFEPRTVVVCLLVGIGVTVVAAVGPARRAVRIQPVEALREGQSETDVSSRRRSLIGGALALVGALLIGVGLARPAISIVGVGAVGLFVGVAMLAPAFARPLSAAIGRPLARLLGAAGRLGRQNSMRSPRRTAQTASALMVGLALVSAISVYGASAKKSATSSIDNTVTASLIVTNGSGSGTGNFAPEVVQAVSTVPGVTVSTTIYGGQFEIRQSVETLRAVSPEDLSKTVVLHVTSGSVQTLRAGELLIDSSTAKSDHLSVGDAVPVKFALTGSSTMRIGGIFKANVLIGSYLVSDSFFLTHYQNPLPGGVLLDTAGNTTSVEQRVQTVLVPYPNVQVQSRAQFEKSQTATVNTLLGLVYALLGLAVVIALIGIVNTLMLSVFERTREIGLLRAVGMQRRQIRLMIRAESVILAVFGAVIGIIIGTGLGVAFVSSLRSQGITDTVVPISNLILFLILSAVLGLLAAGWPARRAARLDILAAIATE